MMRVMSTAEANFSEPESQPNAMTFTIAGAKIIPAMQSEPTTTTRNRKVTRTRWFASSFPFFVWYSVSTGTKAEDIDPSAKSSLRRFGMRKATKNTSDVPVAPKKRARIISRTKPRMRLMKVAMDITPAARAIFPFELMHCFPCGGE